MGALQQAVFPATFQGVGKLLSCGEKKNVPQMSRINFNLEKKVESQTLSSIHIRS